MSASTLPLPAFVAGESTMRGASPRVELMTHDPLETRDLTIRFGGHVAVNGVSCAFRPGKLTAIVGPNGAGKTTYFNLISGQLRPSAGSVLLDGDDITAAFRAAAHPRRPRPRLPAHQSVSRISAWRRTCGSRCRPPAACITTCCGRG